MPIVRPTTDPQQVRAVTLRPWWIAPAPLIFGAIVLLASSAVFLQDVVFPPKPVDPRTNVVLPGGGTFCDPVPQAPPAPIENRSPK